MKKLLSIILATLMLVSCFSITASAETTDPSGGLKLIQLFKDNGIDVEAATVIGAVGDKELCYGSQGAAGDAITEFIIGEYLYVSSDTELGLYIKDGENVYDLVKAYEQGVINDEDMASIDDILDTLKTEQDKDYGITRFKFAKAAELSLQSRYGDIDFNLLPLCKPKGEAWLYANIVTDLTGPNVSREIGGYEFRLYTSQTPYDLGIYALYAGKMYTLEEAFEKGYFKSLDLIAQAIRENDYVQYSFSVSEIEGLRGVMLREYPKGTFMMKALGTIGDYTLYYNDIEPVADYNYISYIGDYKFMSDVRQSSYFLGLYLVSTDRKTVYTLKDAVDDGIVTDMDEVYNMIMARSDELDYHFTAEKIIPDTPEKLFELTFETNSKNLVQLGTVQDYGLYCEDLGTIEGPLEPMEPVECGGLFGNYWFHSGQCMMRPSGLYLYIMSDTEAYTFEDAYEKGIITDVDTVYEILQNSGKEFHFTMKKLSDPEVLLCKRTGYGYFQLEKIGQIKELGIYYDVRETTYLEKVSAKLGALQIESDYHKTPYKLGLYAISASEAYYLEDAYRSGVLRDIDALYDILKENEEKYTYKVYFSEDLQLFKEQGFTVSWTYSFGEVGDSTLYSAGQDATSPMEHDVTIGSYEFHSNNISYPYYLGLYIKNNGVIYKLEEAYEQNIINDEDMDRVYALLREPENRNYCHCYVVKLGDATAEEALLLQYYKDNELYVNGPDEEGYAFEKLGEYAGYSLCFGYSHRDFNNWNFKLGEYKIYMESCCEALYLVNDTQVIPVTQAVEQGIVTDIDELVYILEYHWFGCDHCVGGFEIYKNGIVGKNSFCASLNGLLSYLGLSNFYPEVTPENMYDIDGIEIYGETNLYAAVHIVTANKTPTKQFVKSYTFNSESYLNAENPCGYFYYNSQRFMRLNDVSERTIEKLAQCIPNSGYGDAENKYYVLEKYLKDTEALNSLNSNRIIISEIGIVRGYTLMYGLGSETIPIPVKTVIGEYEFKAPLKEMYSNCLLNLYLLKDGEVVPFDAASYENGLINDEIVGAVAKLVEESDYARFENWTITKQEPVGPDVVSKTKFKAGEQAQLLESGKADENSFKSDNEKVAKVDGNGVVTALRKGEAKITFTVSGTETEALIKVTSNPKLEKKEITVKKNKVKKVKLTGKVAGIKNTYKNTKKAEIISGKNATKLKIKGLKKGTTTLKIKVNGVKTLKLKVKVV